MGVNHRGAHIFVAQQFLHRPDVRTAFEQVRSKRMAERVGAGLLVHTARPNRLGDRPAHGRFMGVVATLDATAGIDRQLRGWKGVLPLPFLRRVRVLAIQSMGQIDRTKPLQKIPVVEFPNPLQVVDQLAVNCDRQHRSPVFVALAFPNGNLVEREVKIFYPQSQRFQKPYPRAVQEQANQAREDKGSG